MKRFAARLCAALFLTSVVAPVSSSADPTPQVDSTGTLPCCPSPRFLGPRSRDGYGVDATFDTPASITYDADDDAFFIADTGSNTIRRLDPNGRVSTVAGACDRELLTATCVGRELDGIGSIARFDRPISIAYDHKQQGLFVYDGASSALRFVTTNGRVSTRGFIGDVQGLAVNSRSGILYAARRNAVVVLYGNGGTQPIEAWRAPNRDGRNSGAPVGQVNADRGRFGNRRHLRRALWEGRHADPPRGRWNGNGACGRSGIERIGFRGIGQGWAGTKCLVPSRR